MSGSHDPNQPYRRRNDGKHARIQQDDRSDGGLDLVLLILVHDQDDATSQADWNTVSVEYHFLDCNAVALTQRKYHQHNPRQTGSAFLALPLRMSVEEQPRREQHGRDVEDDQGDADFGVVV